MSPPDAANPLELSGADLRQLTDAAMTYLAAHIDSLADQPAHDLGGAAKLARELREAMPEHGVAADDALALLFERAVPKSFNTAGPGYLAYIPGGGLPQSAVADLISDVVNRYVGVWLAAPALVELEANVVRWFAEIVEYPPESRGFLTGGGSMANFSAIVTARREKLPEDFLQGTIYVSDQVHHSVAKAAMLAGFPRSAVRQMPTDEQFCIDPGALERAIAADRAAGHQPFLIVASAGTTNTGAVDDCERLADIAAREGLWLHADAAYGGFFMMTERGRAVMRGMERSDSITLDPHKGLFLPYGTGSLLVRDGEALRRAHALDAEYLPAMRDGEEFVDFCQISPELSRDFRGLRVWLPFKLAGAVAFRRNLDEKLDLTLWATEELRTIPGIELIAEPQLSVVAFRWAGADLPAEELNRLNREFLARINARGNVYLTATTVGQRFLLRICVLSFRTHLDRMEQALRDIRAAAEEIAAPS